LAIKVPEAIFDAKEAGKCLAFEVPTAAGFHLFRLLEVVMRTYFREVSGKDAGKRRTIGTLLNALKKNTLGDTNTVFILEEIAKRYRNLIIHPDAVFTTDDVMGVLGLVQTAVTEMLKEIRFPTPSTTTGLAQLYPDLHFEGPADAG
jgi:hypothetical protein